jgi:lipopolysaccharide export system permease protein
LRANGWQAGPYAVAYANIIALPMFCLALLLLALPFGLQQQRAGGVLARIGLGLALGFAFFLLRNGANAYALAGRLEPWLAAAVPVAVGLLLAFFLMVWLREE